MKHNLLHIVVVITNTVTALLVVFSATGNRPASASAISATNMKHHLRQLLDDGSNNNQTATMVEEEGSLSFFAFLSQWVQMDPDTLLALYGDDNSTMISDDEEIDAEGNFLEEQICTYVASPLYDVMYDLYSPFASIGFGLSYLALALFYPFYVFAVVTCGWD